MRFACILLLFLAAVIANASANQAKPHYDLNRADEYFKIFMKKYNRQYKDEADKQIHFEAFKKSLVIINENNKGSHGAIHDINNFADYTEEELKNLFGRLPVKTHKAPTKGSKPHYDLRKANTYFELFIKQYNRQYKDDADRHVHYKAFRKTLRTINVNNRKDTGATYDINQFADYTAEELSNLYGRINSTG